jgi:hypothetical protein
LLLAMNNVIRKSQVKSACRRWVAEFS